MSAKKLDHMGAPRGLWWFAFVTGCITLGSGSYGMWQYEHDQHTHQIEPLTCAFSSLYFALQMLILHTPHFGEGSNGWIELGRWAGAVTLLVTTGLLLGKRLAHEWRMIRMSWFRWEQHSVVCGLGEKGLEIVRCLKEFNPKTKEFNPSVQVVVIDKEPDEHFVAECAALDVGVIIGDATDKKILERARVAVAKEVIAITPGDETNIRIALSVRDLCVAHESQSVDCFAHLANIHLRERLQPHASENAGIAKAHCQLKFFDVFDDEARRVLLNLPIDGTGISKADPRTVHLVILGFGRMGRSLALRAAKMGHFANGKLLRISVIDRHADRHRDHFLFHHPILAEQNICQLNFLQADAQSIGARKSIEGWAAEADTLLHLFVCLDDNACAVEVGLRLQEALAKRADCTLKIRIKQRASLAGILELDSLAGPKISAFGMVEDTCCDNSFRDGFNEDRARIIYEKFVDDRKKKSSRTAENDLAMKPWEDLREDFRESNRQQADHIEIKLRGIGCELVKINDGRDAMTQFTLGEIELLAELEHKRWCAERQLAGWRHGEADNKAELISKSLVEWDDERLKSDVKDFDRQAVANIPLILQSSNPPLKVVRKKTA